jgi:translocation and assembly module TamB
VRWLRFGLFGVLALGLMAAAAVAALYWLLGTERGAQWAAPQLLARGGGIVSIGAVHGSLLGELRLEEVRLRLPSDELDIDVLVLKWNTAAALAGELAFDTVSAGNASYRRLPSVADGGALPAVPWPIRAEAVTVDSLSITIGERTLTLETTRARVRVQNTRLALDGIETTTLDFAANGEAAVDWRSGIALDVAAGWSGPLAGVPAGGRITLAGAWPRLTVAHELGTPFAATTTGEIDLTATPRIDLASTWRALAWPGVDAIASPSGMLTLVGTLADYRFEGAGALEVTDRATTFSTAGSGSELTLAIERLELAPQAAAGGAAGTLLASGEAHLGARTARLAVTAADFDPAWVDAAWPGRLGGTVDVDVALAPTIAASLSAIDLRGSLRGYPLALRGATAYAAPNQWRFDDLALDSEGNTARLAGTLDSATLAIDAAVDVADTGLLWPGLGGSLRGSVALAGSLTEPRARGRLTGRDLTFADARAAVVTLDGEAGLAAATPVRLNVDATGVERGPVVVQRARLVLMGTTAAHTAAVEVEGNGWHAEAAARGGLENGTVWLGTLEALELAENVLGPWRLEEAATLTFGTGGVTLANSCLQHESGALWCSELDILGRPDDRLVVSAQNFDLATLQPLLPPALTLDGTYQLSASLFDVTGNPRGALGVSGSRTRARVAYGDAQAYATELDNVQAGVTLTDGRLELAARLRSTAAGSAEVEAVIADVRAQNSSIAGALRVTWPDLSFLTLLSSELEQVGGTIEIDLDIAGTVDQPTVDGRASWNDGSVAVPEWGFVVENIQGMATSDDGRALDFDASGQAGDGMLTLTGRTALDPSAGWPTRLTLRGDEIRAVQLPDVEILASPNLDVYLALPEVTIAGSVHVPRASIELAVLPEQAVRPSPDAVVHGLDESARVTTPLLVRTAVDLTLGDDVRYAALQLETKVSGGLRLQTEPGQSANATGSLRLVGSYDAYGRNLELERGQLIFTGPIANPGLDVRAVRTLDAVTVGIELGGTVQEPRTRVFSTPTMNEADALSYLLFGRPVTMPGGGGADAEQSSTLQAAALSLGLRQALPAVQRLGTSLGLDELTVQSTASDAGAVMAGKYLSPRVYIRYSYGLFNRIGGLMLRFRVNERLSLETRSGDQKSMDLLYTVEKD